MTAKFYITALWRNPNGVLAWDTPSDNYAHFALRFQWCHAQLRELSRTDRSLSKVCHENTHQNRENTCSGQPWYWKGPGSTFWDHIPSMKHCLAKLKNTGLRFLCVICYLEADLSIFVADGHLKRKQHNWLDNTLKSNEIVLKGEKMLMPSRVRHPQCVIAPVDIS